METGRELIARISGSLCFTDVADYEARVIAEHITGDSYSDLLVGKYELNERQNDSLSDIIKQRNIGKPLAYIIHSATFRDLDLYVDERVLIPRSETEVVVQHAIDIVNSEPGEKTVIDMCTGSGAIALSIAHEVVNAHVYAVDISSDALDVARLNGSATGSAARRVDYFCGNLFEPLPQSMKGKVDLIISNPPYVSEEEMNGLDSSVLDYEPHLALFGGHDGTQFYAKIIHHAREWLRPRGHVVLEISPLVAEAVSTCASINDYNSVEIFQDFLGRDRVAILS